MKYYNIEVSFSDSYWVKANDEEQAIELAEKRAYDDFDPSCEVEEVLDELPEGDIPDIDASEGGDA